MLGGDAYAPTKIKTPNQVSKLGSKGKKLAARLAHKPEGKLTLAPVDDKRPAEKLGPSPVDTFGDM
jgi:hypothetical protein